AQAPRALVRTDRPEADMRQTVIAAAGLLFAGSALGCMSFSIGGRTEVVAPDGSCSETGTAYLLPGEDLFVYYPIPFVSPPNLVLANKYASQQYQLIEQRSDGFRLKNLDALGNASIEWTARGIKVVPTAAPPITVGSSPPP